ncbi:hypothetical protein BB558_003332 [Smittium angustum]|uniref:EF-hand domain-containing protein n=1 Tax=Smittium angustum TaxID=133377 RepID=A0A2U1J6H0_SMIAN|nr:hypothetical protein BB558_003332 [Smittium angustum]
MLQHKPRNPKKNSNAFAIFDQKQILELKEAFSTFDYDNDSIIDKEDIKDVMKSLGADVSEEYIEEMIAEAPGPINFTMFLTMMGEHLNGTDPEAEILAAFEAFDENGNGLINANELTEALMYMGDRLSQEEIDAMFRSVPIDQNGMVVYKKLVQMLKNGE